VTVAELCTAVGVKAGPGAAVAVQAALREAGVHHVPSAVPSRGHRKVLLYLTEPDARLMLVHLALQADRAGADQCDRVVRLLEMLLAVGEPGEADATERGG
jgi:hypothetical protein